MEIPKNHHHLQVGIQPGRGKDELNLSENSPVFMLIVDLYSVELWSIPLQWVCWTTVLEVGVSENCHLLNAGLRMQSAKEFQKVGM